MAENSAAPIGPIPLPEPPSALTADDREQDRAQLRPSDHLTDAAKTDLLSRDELVRYFRTEEYADEIADIISNFPPAEHITGVAQPTPGRKLAELVLEYARDLRRNSSGGDDYPWEYAKGTADYLEELVRRSGVEINMSHAILSENAGQVFPDLGPNWCPDNPHIAAMFSKATQPPAAPVHQEDAYAAWAKDYERSSAETDDVRWAVNCLLEQIAAKFEAWDTFDLFRSEAAATVRSFKHDLSSAPPQEAPNRENLRPFAEWADRNRSAVSHEAADELILLARKACDAYGPLSRPHGARE